MNYNELINTAINAQKNSYSPYSGFKVGVALFCASGKVFTGANVENASYSLTNCAERTAFFSAIAEGERGFTAIAIIGDGNDYCYPCGSCRQVMAEFCKEDFEIIAVKTKDDYKILTLKELLPHIFKI